jgi:hypothetical protein
VTVRGWEGGNICDGICDVMNVLVMFEDITRTVLCGYHSYCPHKVCWDEWER